MAESARPAAVGSLDDDYHCITTLPGLNVVRASAHEKTRECGKLTANEPFLMNWQLNDQGDDRPGRPVQKVLAFELYLQDFSWQADQAGLGHIGWPFVRWPVIRGPIMRWPIG